MPSAKSSVCKLCPNHPAFDDAAKALKHHIDFHTLQNCRLCERKDSATAGHQYCADCRTRWPELSTIENADAKILSLLAEVSQLRKLKEVKFYDIKKDFEAHRFEIICPHGIHTVDDCRKCEHQAAAVRYVHLDLD